MKCLIRKYLVNSGGLVFQLAVISMFSEPWIKEDVSRGETDPLDRPPAEPSHQFWGWKCFKIFLVSNGAY